MIVKDFFDQLVRMGNIYLMRTSEGMYPYYLANADSPVFPGDKLVKVVGSYSDMAEIDAIEAVSANQKDAVADSLPSGFAMEGDQVVNTETGEKTALASYILQHPGIYVSPRSRASRSI